MSADIVIKRGDSLELHIQHQSAGAAQDLTGWQIASSLRSASGAQVYQFTPRITDAAAGRFVLEATAAETARWPTGLLAADIRYRNPSGRVHTTATFSIQILREVTR